MKEKLFDFVSIQLDRNGKTALYVQLYDALREAIEADIGNARAYFAAHPFCERTIP